MIIYEALCNELKRLYHKVRIDPHQADVHEIENLALAVFPRPGSGEHPTVSIVLTAGLVVPPDLKHLAWGMFDGEGQLVGFGRTNAHGTLLATMPPGEYRLRYVL